jgi:hypothetical protein
MKRAIKVDFSELIGNKYPLETKMAIVDWMLKTGKSFKHSCKWNVDGINKSLLNYSANNHNVPLSLPNDSSYALFFDAIFARAVYAKENKPLKEWRNKESIYPNKYRMLKINETCLEFYQPSIHQFIGNIFDFNGRFLKKELHHASFEERTNPKIISIRIATSGSGWFVHYQFSFGNFNYEPGWTKGFHQSESESIVQFIKKSYDELCSIII